MVHQVTWLRRLVSACLGAVCVPNVSVLWLKLLLPLWLGVVLTPGALWINAAETAVVCAEHQVVEAKCTLCNPALIPGFKAMNDWCAGHELPESVCPQCSHGTPAPPPISADDWCAEHQVPESRCTLCHAELIPGFQAMQDWCAEHQLPESVCPICRGGPVLVVSQGDIQDDEEVPPGRPDPLPGSDWCDEHGVPESKCTLCNPALIPGFKAMNDWCAGHELPESVCPQCSHGTPEPPPISADDWCAGHQVPESRCTLCHPELVPGFKAMQDWCAEHQLPESVCPICRGEPVLAIARAQTTANETLTAADLAQRVVRFLDPAKETQAGIAVTAIRRGAFQAVVEAPARVAFDADRVAQLRAVVDGVVQKIHVPLGAEVRAGTVVFDLVSPEIGAVQARLRAAQTAQRVAETHLQRQRQLAARDIVGAWDVEQAELSLETARAEVAAATTTLQTVGATAEGPPGIFSVRAPMSGTLVRREAVAGARAGHDHPLGLIVDTRSLWIFADVAENDAAQLEIGATLAFTADDGQGAQGRVTWLAAEVDADSRTVLVRADVANPGGLRANQFGRARITLPETQNTWLVPAGAVQHYQNQALVFVRRAQGLYQPRAVQPIGDGDWQAVRADLNAGDQVVTTGAVLLLTEMLPGSIGAGCCEVEPLGDAKGGR